MGKCVLVVDDDEMNLRRTKVVLKSSSYEVVLASSGTEALDKLKSEHVDLVLLDIEMPGMNGIDTFQHIRQAHSGIPVIFLTASGDQDNVMNVIKMGAANYVKKPFMPEDLLERIAKVLEKE